MDPHLGLDSDGIQLCILNKCIPEPVREFLVSPREIVTGLSTDCNRDCKADIESYVEASTNATVTNDNTERTHSCVALGPVGNRQGSVKCWDIESGKVLHRRTVTQLP